MQVTTTISRGRLAWHGGEFKLAPGTSRFVPTPPKNMRLFPGKDTHDASGTERLTDILNVKDEL